MTNKGPRRVAVDGEEVGRLTQAREFHESARSLVTLDCRHQQHPKGQAKCRHEHRQRAKHAAMDAVHDLEAAINSLQGDINAAITDVGRATTPEQRSNAERRLAKLMEQERRLEDQLGMAKLRQLNVRQSLTNPIAAWSHSPRGKARPWREALAEHP